MKISFTAGLIRANGYSGEAIYLNPNNVTMIKQNSGNKNKCFIETVNNCDNPYKEIMAPASAVAEAFHRAQLTNSIAKVRTPDEQ